MNPSRHCELCDHQEVTLQEGSICQLTSRKPEFNRTCPQISLTQKFEERLKNVNIEYKKVKGQKGLTYVYFGVFLAIGVAVIVGGYLLGKYALDAGVISTVPLIIMGVGIIPLGMAFGALNNHRQKLQSAKFHKSKVDEVLDVYRITYDIDIEFGKKYHGVQDVYVDLKTKGIR